jgi:hypothetical protein
MADVNDIVAYGFGSWSTVNSIPTSGFAIGVAVVATGQATTVFAAEQPSVSFSADGVEGEVMGRVTYLSGFADEKGTYGIAATFTDEDDAALTPDTLTWTLSTLDGTIINGKQDVAIVTPASTTTVVLSGDDLAVLTDDNRVRRFTLEGTFTSDLGAGVPLKAECQFQVADFVGVT